MNWRKLPKVELHIHLDCSLSYNLVKKLKPSISRDEYKSDFRAPVNCNSLNDYIIKAEPAIELMQSREALRLSVLDLADQFAKDRVVYAEIRFAPLEHCRKGLSDTEVAKAVENAAEEASEAYGIEIFVILCSLRHYTSERSLRVAELAAAFKGSRIVALDLAGDETLPAQPHEAAFRYAVENNVHRTSHAGEACGSKSVDQSICLFQIERIGHGVRSWESRETLDLLKEKNIHLEVCPSSNILTGIYPNISVHAVDKIRKYGVSLGINTDGRTISNVDLTREYEKLAETFNWTTEDFLKHNLEAIEHAFAPENVKASVKKQLLSTYEKLMDK